MLRALQKRCRALYGDLPQFPSLLITASDLVPQGPYAEAQARFLRPDAAKVARLVRVLREKRIGVVAHFYMDPEVQGVLSSAADEWPHISISGALYKNAVHVFVFLSGLFGIRASLASLCLHMHVERRSSY
jgi:quinolinate synthase